jgi:hypothetical protein
VKRNLSYIFALSIILGTFFYLRHKARPDQKWTTYEKQQDKKIVSHQSTKKELKDIKQFESKKPRPKNLRAPASLAKKIPQRYGRELVGQRPKDYVDSKTRLPMINTPNKEWKEKLGNELLRFQSPETKVFVQAQKELIHIEKGSGRYVAQVLVSYLGPHGKRSSFQAIVDQQSGRVLTTYNRSIQENYNRRPAGLVPSGTL